MSNSTPGWPSIWLIALAAGEMADGEPVRLDCFVNVIGCDHHAGTGHIIDDDGRFTGNVLGHLPRDHARVGIKTAARRAADDDAHGLAFEESVLGINVCEARAASRKSKRNPVDESLLSFDLPPLDLHPLWVNSGDSPRNGESFLRHSRMFLAVVRRGSPQARLSRTPIKTVGADSRKC